MLHVTYDIVIYKLHQVGINYADLLYDILYGSDAVSISMATRHGTVITPIRAPTARFYLIQLVPLGYIPLTNDRYILHVHRRIPSVNLLQLPRFEVSYQICPHTFRFPDEDSRRSARRRWLRGQHVDDEFESFEPGDRPRGRRSRRRRRPRG